MTQPNIQRLEIRRILVELPELEILSVSRYCKYAQRILGDRIKDKLTSFLFQANELLKQTVAQASEEPQDDNSEIDDLLADIEAQQDSVSVVQNPIFDLVVDIIPGPVLVRITEKTKLLLKPSTIRSQKLIASRT